MNGNDWIFPAGLDDSVSTTHYGFVYIITHILTGRMYIGRKYFTAKRAKKRIQSDWRNYYGSCKPLLEEMSKQGKELYRREILSVHMKRSEVNYAEVEEQIKRDVLKALLPNGTRAYYNGNIMNRWFAAPLIMKPEHRAKISKALTGRKLSAERRAKQGATIKASGRKPPSPKGRKQSDETKAKLAAYRKANPIKLTDDEKEILRDKAYKAFADPVIRANYDKALEQRVERKRSLVRQKYIDVLLDADPDDEAVSQRHGINVSKVKDIRRGTHWINEENPNVGFVRGRKAREMYDYKGELMSIFQLQKLSPVCGAAIKRRIAAGWTVKEAVETEGKVGIHLSRQKKS